jgi:sulfur carrier protein ThiS
MSVYAQALPCVCMGCIDAREIINLLASPRRMVEVFIEKGRRTVEIAHEGSVRALLERVGVLPETVLIVRDGTLVTEDDEVGAAARIELLSVISGG